MLGRALHWAFFLNLRRHIWILLGRPDSFGDSFCYYIDVNLEFQIFQFIKLKHFQDIFLIPLSFHPAALLHWFWRNIACDRKFRIHCNRLSAWKQGILTLQFNSTEEVLYLTEELKDRAIDLMLTFAQDFSADVLMSRIDNLTLKNINKWWKISDLFKGGAVIKLQV